MPLQNRVSPDGQIFATSARGTFLGNRGILHDENKRIVRQSRGSMWLICQLEFNGRKQELMHPNRYTQLFFLDEAVALAAGHRPCGECRRAAYRAYIQAANAGGVDPILGSSDLDKKLSASRRAPRTSAVIAELPDGVFIALGSDDFWLVWRGALYAWSPEGYGDPVAITDTDAAVATVLTPALSVDALRHGYPVNVHPSIASGAPDVPRATSARTSSTEAPPKEAQTKDAPLRRTPIAKAPAEIGETSTADMTPEQRSEVEHILRNSSPGLTHGEVFRYREQGLNADEISSRHGTSLSNIRSFMQSLDHLFGGTLPTSRSAARTNSFVYKELLNHHLSPELLSYVQRRLRRLMEINPEITMEPLRTRSRQHAPKQTHPAVQPPVCPQCHCAHAGECA